MKKIKVVFIFARLVGDPEAYKGKTNADIEREILEEVSLIPYVTKNREGYSSRFHRPPK